MVGKTVAADFVINSPFSVIPSLFDANPSLPHLKEIEIGE